MSLASYSDNELLEETKKRHKIAVMKQEIVRLELRIAKWNSKLEELRKQVNNLEFPQKLYKLIGD